MSEHRGAEAPWRVAAIRFFNTAPLLWGLEDDARLALEPMTPARCAAALAAGEADLGIIPVIEMARVPDLAAIPSIGIAARAEVRSILLLSRKPLGEIQTLALDSSSRTSAALVQILLRRRFGARFSTRERAPDWRAMLAEADAALVIGDPALQISVSGEAAAAGLRVHDLASEWHQWTGLPFVFALWAVRGESLAARERGQGSPPAGRAAEAEWLVERFRRARREGGERAGELAAAWAPRLGIPAAEAERYLERDVEYDLTQEHERGLEHFFALAAAEGLIASPAPPRRLAATGQTALL